MVLEQIFQLAVQNPEAVVLLGFVVAALLSWNRVPARVPFISELYVSGAIVVAVSLFYKFAISSNGVRAVFDGITGAIFFGAALLAIKKYIDIKAG